jgi:hypothetical protein
MRHLKPAELLDLADGTRGDASAPHLETCDACREQLADLRATLTRAMPVDVPEPSPLYWEHLSARVREAVSATTAPGQPFRLAGWFSSRVLFSTAACAVVLLAAVVALRTPSWPAMSGRPESPVRNAAPASAAAGPSRALDAVDSPADDPSWSLMTDLVSGVDWDTAVEAGLSPAGNVERALFDLTVDERRELQRLLKQELSGSGA